MRYDDASQAGSMASDHSPVARPDADALPAGSYGPASGNVITGAGTTTGSSGEDRVGDAPAHIVAVQGAAGAAANSGGTFQATGQYGVLSVDADGNFNYARNAGTPDGVQDVFNYTLADRDGEQSSTTLTIDIGKSGSQQATVNPGTAPVIPGVVNLPAGVQMSDIHVNGRDLVINMPDGTQMVIPGGAVFVPQLVIGDVQVPASNLAAVLIQSEPQPAAGELQSSGGNFASDVPPLDPGVPLGDLIPPTELVFTPPEFVPVGQVLDVKPTGGSVSVQLDDDALAGGNPGGTGDDPDSVNATGTLAGGGGDLPIHFDLLDTGAPAGFTYVDGPNGSILVQQVQDGNTVTVLTITVDPATGAYTVTENAPILHPAGGDENNVVFVINYNVVDHNGDTAPGTITINVDDDTPVVSNVQTGPGVTLDETDAGSPAGFPISATSSAAAISATLAFGADGASGAPVYALSLNGGGSTLSSGLSTAIGDHPITLNLTSPTLITATYTDGSGTHTAFTVALNPDGTITVTQDVPLEHPVASSPDTDETLSLAGLVNATVTITDRDGDSATGTAPIGAGIVFHDDGPAIALADHSVPNLVVDETDLSANASASFADNFTANFGADGAGAVTYSLGISAPGADSGLVDSATGQAIVLVLNNGVVEGHVGSASGDLAFTVSVDASGTVTLDQIRSVVHPDGTNPDTDESVTLGSDNLLTLTATATDSDGDSASQSLAIGTHLVFHDDGPTIGTGGAEPSLTVDESDLSANATTSFAAIFNGISFGADGPAASNATSFTLGISSTGADSGLVDSQSGNHVFLFLEGGVVVGREGADAGAAAAGPVVFTVSVDSDGNVTLDQSRAVIHPDGTSPDTSEGVTLGADNLITLSGTITDADGDQATATASIGQNLNFNDDGPSISASSTHPSLTVDETDLSTNDSASFASVFNASFGNDGPAASNSLSYSLGISAAGADSGLVDSATGQAIVLVLNGGVVEGHVGTAGGALAFTVSVDASGTVTLDQARAVVHPDGTSPDASEGVTLGADNLVTLTATATDADGDQASATANIGQSLNFLDDGPTISASGEQPSLTVDETNLAANDSTSFAGVFSGAFGNDGPAASNATVYTLGISAPGADSGLVDSLTGQNIVLVLNGNTVEGHVGDASGAVAFTVSVDSSGVVTLDQVRAVIHSSPDNGDISEPATLAGDNLVTLTATITDADGDSATATANIGQNLVFNDDGPLAANDTVNQPTENQAFSFDVFGNDSFGNDGVNIHDASHVTFTQPAQGTVSYDATTGLFTFTPAAGQQGSTTFTYTIIDADGDHSTATVTVNLGNDSVPVPTAQVAFSDDDGLATGNPASTNGDIDANQGETPSANPSEVIYNGQLVVNFGSDTPGSITFANLNGMTGAVGLETVNYSWNAGTNTLTATTVGGSRPGTVLFDIHVTNTATGTYVLTQHTNILETGANETSALPVVLHYQAVDSDGSTSTAGTLSITFNDDAPTVTAGGTVPTLTVDETNLAGDASTSFAGVFSHNFGADGAASSNSVTYQLGISASGANSGLVDSLTGKNIVLVLNGNVVEGHVETTGGALAFTVSVNSSGAVTLDQIRAVMHPTGTDPDTSEGVTLSASNLVTLTQTVTDADGDSATATANVGQNLVFNDDGPVNFTPVHLTDTNNSTPIAQDNALIDDGNANVTRLINDSNNDGTGENFIGNDGFASINGLVFTAGTHTNGEQLLDASSNPLTSGGQPIYVFGWGTGTLIATTDATDTDASKVVFTMTLNTGAGLGSNSTYSIDFNHSIDNGSGVSFNNLTSTKAGNTNVYGIGANATGSPDVDAMLTGTHNGVNSTVNTDATSIGVGNQSFNPGDSLRMDFVTHMVSDAGNATLGFDYTAHVETNGFQQKVPQVVGTPTVVSFTVWALETSDTQSNYPDSNPTGNFTDTSKVAITEVWVQGHTAGEPKIAPVDITGLAVGSTQALAYGISVTKNADGSVTFSGVEQGDSYGIGTGANHFNSVDVQDVTGKFDLGIFSLTQTNQGHPIDLSFGVTATDADGDHSTGTINMTLVPTAAPVVLDLNGDGVHFLSTDAGVHYDYGSGSVATAWASPQDGILAYDANHDGTVSNASEFVFGSNGVSDLQALAAYDTNHDGQLSSADAQFTGFVVWQDANSNGVADAGEVSSLMARGISSISLSSDGISYTAANGDVSVAGTGSYTRADGSTGLLADAAFGIGARDVSDSLRSSTSLASNAALIAAVAAAGLGSQSLAAHGVTGQANSANGVDVAAQHTQAFAPVALDAISAGHGFDLPAIASGAHISVPAAEPNFHAAAVSESSLGLDSASQSGGPSFSALPQGTDAPANGSGAGAAAFTANAVGMPDAALLMAAAHASQGPNVEGQHNEVVGKVLADALHGGGSGPNVDALVNSLPQAGDHGQAAADALATHAAAAVPNGDMGDFAGFTGASALHMMQQMAVHADAVPAHV